MCAGFFAQRNRVTLEAQRVSELAISKHMSGSFAAINAAVGPQVSLNETSCMRQSRHNESATAKCFHAERLRAAGFFGVTVKRVKRKKPGMAGLL